MSAPATRRARWLWPAIAMLLGSTLAACDERPLQAPADNGPKDDEDNTPAPSLGPEQASRVVATIGDETITLGEFAQALERMNEFDRLRYQTKERRRELLDDMVDVELLVQEAKRRGIDKHADVQDAVRQILREAMLAKARSELPMPAEIPMTEVRAYYDANPMKFSEPERRRVAAIVVRDKKLADKTLEQALAAKTAGEWGELFNKVSLTAKKDPHGAVDLAGDLGIVGPAGDDRGHNKAVPDPVRAAVFEIGALGSVLDRVIESEGRFYIVRLIGKTEAHARTLAESDRTIRVALLQQKMQEKERALDEELRRKFPVEIDERALASVSIPAAAQNLDAASKASATSYGGSYGKDQTVEAPDDDQEAREGVMGPKDLPPAPSGGR